MTSNAPNVKQISKKLRLSKQLEISHETIYRYIWKDKQRGGHLYRYLRQALKRRRKRYGAYDSRGVMAGKRLIDDRPLSAANRSRKGHYEADTVLGRGSKHCAMTLVDRKTGYLIIRKLHRRTTAEVNAELQKIIVQAVLLQERRVVPAIGVAAPDIKGPAGFQ